MSSKPDKDLEFEDVLELAGIADDDQFSLEGLGRVCGTGVTTELKTRIADRDDPQTFLGLFDDPENL